MHFCAPEVKKDPKFKVILLPSEFALETLL